MAYDSIYRCIYIYIYMSSKEKMTNIRFRRHNKINTCVYVRNFHCLNSQIDPTRDLIKRIRVIIKLSKPWLVLSTLSWLWLRVGLPFTPSSSWNLVELCAVLSGIMRLKNTRYPREQENARDLVCNFRSFNINTFAASYLNTQGLNNSCLKSPASTLLYLTFQSRALRSFSSNQLRNLSL